MREQLRSPERQDAAFAENVKRLREAAGWSKAEVVRMLKEAGWENIHQTTVTRIEKGERPARLGEARIYASIFETTVENLVREPYEADAEDWLTHDIAALRNSYNNIVDGVSGLLMMSEQLQDHAAQIRSGVWTFGDGTSQPIKMTRHVEELLKKADLLAGLSVEHAVQKGREYHHALMEGELPEGYEHGEQDEFHL